MDFPAIAKDLVTIGWSSNMLIVHTQFMHHNRSVVATLLFQFQAESNSFEDSIN